MTAPEAKHRMTATDGETPAGQPLRARRRLVAGVALAPALALLLFGSTARGAVSHPRLGPIDFDPPAAWVVPVPCPAPATVEGTNGEGRRYLLFDEQERVGGAQTERFRHYVTEVLNATGIAASSEVEIVFDPEYQSVSLHRVVVHRGGELLERLVPERVELIQRERRLEYRIYDGKRSALLFVEDVRVGDLVEVAYTVRGLNPTLGGLYVGGFSVAFGVPLGHLYHRLLWPHERHLYVKPQRTALEPTITRHGAVDEYLWEARKIPAAPSELHTPAWYDGDAWVQLSELETWADVARWGVALYAAVGDSRDDAALDALVAQIVAQSATPAERAAAALRFVQDEIRYLGVELGTNAHTPTAPAETLRRRYGDCKDKSLLLATVLTRLGMAARPALVDSEHLRGIERLHPSPFGFDHVIVRAELDGATLWLDPTRALQRGPLAELPRGDFGRALVLAPETVGLSEVPPPTAATDTLIHQRLELKAPPNGAELRVESVLRGRAAEDARRWLADVGLEAVQRSYTSFYARQWPRVTVTAPLEVEDHDATNVLETHERYAVPDFWRRDDDGTAHLGALPDDEIRSALDPSSGATRTAPLAVSHPTRLEVVSEVVVPGSGWSFDPEKERVDADAFSFERTVTWAPPTLTVRYVYASKADSVAADRVGEHLAAVERARRLIGYELYHPIVAEAAAGVAPESSHRFNWSAGFVAVLAALLALALLVPPMLRRAPGAGRQDVPEGAPGVGPQVAAAAQTVAAAEPNAATEIGAAAEASAEASAEPPPEGPQEDAAPANSGGPSLDVPPFSPVRGLDLLSTPRAREVGGWLIVLLLVLLASAVVNATVVVRGSYIFDSAALARLADNTTALGGSGFVPLVLAELTLALGLAVSAVCLAAMLLLRRRAFRAAATVFFIVTALGAVAEVAVGVALDGPSLGVSTRALALDALKGVFWASVWIAYLSNSERVKETFRR